MPPGGQEKKNSGTRLIPVLKFNLDVTILHTEQKKVQLVLSINDMRDSRHVLLNPEMVHNDQLYPHAKLDSNTFETLW